MNRYRIHYRDGSTGVSTVRADEMRITQTRFTFYREEEGKQILVATIPQEVVASIHKIDEESTLDEPSR